MKAEKRLYVTADRKKVVGEGDSRAAFLLVGKGQEIPVDVVKQYGLRSKAETKESKPREDKGTSPPEKETGFKINQLKDQGEGKK
ncbi:MAG: hypothetical protein NOU37_09245 [Candidatus Brocadiales bacterium]|nr:hypothetical protein [Candidatus Bathyanammoxibius amoris]